jgi:hypothetical protein
MSMAASAIVAQPLTITGSIGVVTGKFNLKQLYERAGWDTRGGCVGGGCANAHGWGGVARAIAMAAVAAPVAAAPNVAQIVRAAPLCGTLELK